MDFKDLARNRRACHHFVPGKKIPRKHWEEMVKTASYSPSGYNVQPWEFVIVTQEDQLKAVHTCTFKQDHILDASGVVFVIADSFIGRRVETLLSDWLQYGYISSEDLPDLKNSIAKVRHPDKLHQMALRNAMIAASTFLYAAESMGYATCPMMGFSQHQMEAILRLKPEKKIALMIAVGTADNSKFPPQLPRKTLKELISWEYSQQ